MNPTFFATPADFRAWLDAHHQTADELWVGFYKKGSGRPSITWPESVDQALCYGWIDGIRKRLDDASYVIRFTPRRKGSNWSEVNRQRVAELSEQGLMQPAGLAAYAARDQGKAAEYAYEGQSRALDDALLAELRANGDAWAFWEAQPPSYRRVAAHWVMDAKRDETRRKRLDTLIEDSAAGRRLGFMARPARREEQS